MEAIQELEQLMQIGFNKIEVQNLLAYTLRKASKNSRDSIQKSIALLEETLTLNPENKLTLFNLGSCYYDIQEFKKSIQHYEKIKNNKDCRVAFNLAVSYEKLNDIETAMQYYDKSLRINPYFSGAIVNYSNLLIRNGRSVQAKALLETYLKNVPNDEKAKNNLNIIMAEKKLDRKAEDQFLKMVKEQHPNQATLYNHGIFLYK